MLNRITNLEVTAEPTIMQKMAVIGWASVNFKIMSKQTAVDWLLEQLKEYDFADIQDSENYIIKIPAWILTEKQEKAKEMERQQIIKVQKETTELLAKTLIEVRKHMTAHIPEKVFDMVDDALSKSSFQHSI